MTFYEAALQVLAEAGKPLTYQEITKFSLEKELLSHIGKAPEDTMLARLKAVAKRMHDKPIVVTAKDTFALREWMLPEDPDALAFLDAPWMPFPEKVLPLRPSERHPRVCDENVRFLGKSLERRRREEGEGRRKRFPPLPEVAFELLSTAGCALLAEELLREAKAKELVSAECELSTLLAALTEDNQRRAHAGRRPQFQCQEAAGGKWEVQLESAGLSPEELQEGFARALNTKAENGRMAAAKPGVGLLASRQQQSHFQAWARDERKALWKFLRSYLAELDIRIFERAMLKLLGALRFREIKIAKRSKEAVLLTARKREGSLDLRYTIRLLSRATAVERKHIQALRSDLTHHHATLGMLCSAGDLRGEARNEAMSHGEPLIMLWCGDALAEKFLETTLGVQKHVIEFFEFDEAFFERLQNEVITMDAKREARMRDRKQSEVASLAETVDNVPKRDEAEEGEATVVRRKKNRRRRRVRRPVTEEMQAQGVELQTAEDMATKQQADFSESVAAEATVSADTPRGPSTEED